jgi:hypothetical protein
LTEVRHIRGGFHLALQYADRLGYQIVALARGTDKARRSAAIERLGTLLYAHSTVHNLPTSDHGTATRCTG